MKYQFQSNLTSERNISEARLQQLKTEHEINKTNYKIVHPEGSFLKMEFKTRVQVIKVPKHNIVRN